MTIDPKLMKEILSLDSYNRGYNSGIVFGGNPTSLEAINDVTMIGNHSALNLTR